MDAQQTTNRRLMTALRALGYGDDILGEAPPDYSLKAEDFTKLLKNMGITDNDLSTAQGLASMGIGQSKPPPTPAGMTDLVYRGVVENYQTNDRVQTIAETSGTPTSGPTVSKRLPGNIPVPDFTGVGNADAMAGTGKPVPAPAPAAPPADKAVTDKPVLAPTDWAGKAIPHTPQELSDYIRQNYGFAAMALDDPEINAKLHEAASKGLGPDATKGLISGTQWWKTHDDAQRQWIDLESSDHATALRRINQQVVDLQGIAAKSGQAIDPRRLQMIAEISLKNGWSTGQTAAAMASEYHYDDTGQISGINAQLKTQAKNYMVPLADQTFTQWGQKILAGTATMDTFKNYLVLQAKSMLPGISAELDNGFDVKTLMDPYIQRAANLLDMDPNQLADNFTDPKWIRFLNQTDSKGQRVPMSLADMDTTIKTDPIYGWDKTKGAHEEAASMTTSILNKFGM